MPIYVYQCPQCEKKAEEFRHIDQRDNAPECCGKEMLRLIVATMIRTDIAPYRSVAIDKETGAPVNIGSRREHREFLARNDYVEIGNDFAPSPSRGRPTEPEAPVLTVEEAQRNGFVLEDL